MTDSYSDSETAAVVESAENHDVSGLAWEMAEHSLEGAREWFDGHAVPSDNVPTDTLDALENAVSARDATQTAKLAFDIYTTEMHPTADDIVGGAARQCIYSVTGKRAHTFMEA